MSRIGDMLRAARTALRLTPAAAGAADPPRANGPQAKYDAAGQGRRIRGWTPGSTGPNRATEGLQRLRDRARDSTRNDWAGASGVQKWTTALVGVGITPRWKDARFGPVWASWAPNADADNVLNFDGVVALGARSWLDSGEVFVRRRPRNPQTSPLPVPLQVQLIEADYCPIFDALTWQGMPDGNEIRQGIEFNKYGERIAYWMFREHPGDRFKPGVSLSTADLLRIPAREIAHVYEPKRPGQIRGVSELAPVLVRLRNSMDFEDAVLDRQKLANLFAMFITRTLPPEWDDITFNPDTGLPTFYEDGEPIASLEPGIAQELRPGEDVKFANPPEAGTTFSDYMRTTHMGTASGAGLPYELFAGDIMNVSDRTLRIVVNEFRRFAEQRQWHVVIHMLCRRVVEWWADAAVLAGVFPTSARDAAAAPKWSPHGWPDIHPTQDIEGRIAARDAGFVSTSSVIARSGDDPDAVLAERKADETSGLTPKPPEPPAGPGGAPTSGKPKPAPTASIDPTIEKMLGTMALFAQQRDTLPGLDAALAKMTEIVATLASRPPPEPPKVETHVHNAAPAPQPPPIVNMGDTHVHVPEQAAPVVNVPPTQVSVTNEVQPAAVQVDATLHMPDRRTESTTERDDNGNIKRVVAIETTVEK